MNFRKKKNLAQTCRPKLAQFKKTVDMGIRTVEQELYGMDLIVM